MVAAPHAVPALTSNITNSPPPSAATGPSRPCTTARDVTYAEDASTLRTPRHGHLPQLAIGLLITLGAVNIAKATRAIRDHPERALPLLSVTNIQDAQGT